MIGMAASGDRLRMDHFPYCLAGIFGGTNLVTGQRHDDWEDPQRCSVGLPGLRSPIPFDPALCLNGHGHCLGPPFQASKRIRSRGTPFPQDSILPCFRQLFHFPWGQRSVFSSPKIEIPGPRGLSHPVGADGRWQLVSRRGFPLTEVNTILNGLGEVPATAPSVLPEAIPG